MEKIALVHDNLPIAFTVSTGVANLREGENGKDLLNRADQALYRAKLEGGNCSKLADP